MFCYLKNMKKSSAVECGRDIFWEEVRSQKTSWHIDVRRAVKKAVAAAREGEGAAAIHTWLQNSDYQKFLLRRPRELKNKEAKAEFAAKSDEEKLLAWADELKQELTAYVFSCYLFDENKSKKKRERKLKYCHVNGLVMLDIDHVENPMQIWYKLREMKDLMARVALVHISCSGDGIRVIFTADIQQGNLADNQIEFAQAIGYQADGSCIDATRNSFTPKEEDILYINEDLLFDYYDETFDKKYTPLYRDKKTQPENHEAFSDAGARSRSKSKNSHAASETAEHRADEDGSMADQEPLDTTWCGQAIQPICDHWSANRFKAGDTKPSRHDASVVLARDLYIMYDRDKRKARQVLVSQPWVQEIIRERDEDVDRTLSDAADYVAANEHENAKKGKAWLPKPSTEMMESIKAVTGKAYKELVGNEKGEVKSDSMDAQLEAWGEEIETLFPHFPLLKDVCAGLKRSEYPVAMFVAGGIGMTLMTRCWYRFYHRPQQERRLNCALIVIGHPGSNKSMADDIFSLLSSPIAAADKAGKNALNRYKRDRNKKAANKEGEDKPEGIIRLHPARTSNGQLIQDMLNAREMIEGKEIQLHMVTFDTELDNSITLQQGGSWINKQSMELKAFHNEKDGQMYQNQDSPVDEFHVTWNFIYTGTPIALKKKVTPQNFGSGLSTRLAVIPMPKTNFKMIAFEDVSAIDWQRLDRMKSWAYKLDSRFGELPFWELVKHLYDWTANRMADCAEDDSEANELMLKRVPYHALNYSAPFIDMRHWDQLHLDGNYWTGKYETDEIDWKLCELVARIQYATQQHFFGVMAEKYFDDMNNDVQITGKRHYQKSVNGYNQLPEVFTKEDVVKCFGYSNKNGASVKIQRLIDQHLIVDIQEGEDKGKYKKINQML